VSFGPVASFALSRPAVIKITTGRYFGAISIREKCSRPQERASVKAFNRKIRKERPAKDAKKSASPQSTEGTEEKQIAYRVETPCCDCAGVGVQGSPSTSLRASFRLHSASLHFAQDDKCLAGNGKVAKDTRRTLPQRGAQGTADARKTFHNRGTEEEEVAAGVEIPF